MNQSQGAAPKPGSVVTVSEAVWTYLKGLAMGLGDSVPGVSGGTIAVITGIYDRLIYALRVVDLEFCRLLLRGRIAALWRRIDGNFLLLVVLGILSGLLLSANTVLYLLDNHFSLLMAFFIGLVIASCWLLREQYVTFQWQNLLAMLGGALLVLLISQLRPLESGGALPYLFFSGMIAISAMILPGLSGAFILLLLGSYETMLEALLAFDLPVIAVFAGGCTLGVLLASRGIAWLLRHYHQRSYAGITGMLLGSVFVLWPWRRAIETIADGRGDIHIVVAKNVAPWNYLEATGKEAALSLSVVLCIIGIILVLAIHRLGNPTKG